MTEYLAGAARVYRVKWWRRILPLFFVVFGVVFLGSMLNDGLNFQDRKQIVQSLVGPIFILVGSFIAASKFRSCITLTAKAIELHTLFGTKQLPLTAIRGRREYVVNNGRTRTRYLRLEPNDDPLPAIYFEKSYTFDDSFYTWFNGLPDLDEDDRRGHKDSNFGLV